MVLILICTMFRVGDRVQLDHVTARDAEIEEGTVAGTIRSN